MNSVQLILKQKFLELQVKNPRLSNRYFAQKLGISSGALSEILQGKRNVSKKLALKIAQKLQLNPSEMAEFLGEQLTTSGPEFEFTQMQDDQFHLISDWPHFAILNLVKSEKCIHKPSWFAEQLNLPLKVVHQIIERLIRLELLVYKNKKYHRRSSNLKTSDNVLNLSIRKSNIQDLELIQDHLNFLDINERDFTSITLLLDPNKMPEFKKWIRDAQDQFAYKYETTKSISPYRLTVGLFPLKKSQI
ncbi:MAG: TIGR02147 family protein [Pseudobdellovibrionaceae bacterium]